MIRVIVILLILIISFPAYSDEHFKPWNSDVTIADENISIINHGDSLNKKYMKINSNYLYASKSNKLRVRNVYNGFKGGAYFMIRVFQVVISPQDGPNCRYHPVCSAYGKKAVEKFGAFVGSVLVGDRLLRCNPFAPHGHDPVPQLLKPSNK